jgi:acetyltransferase-like isoleucine patch superfamily enzyme
MINNETRDRVYRIWDLLRRDPNGTVLYKFDHRVQEAQMYVYTILCRIFARMWGINLGSSSRFYGITQFSRYPESIIKVGNHCQFRSKFRSNMIGMNRPCGLSTHSSQAKISLGDNCGLSGTVIGAAKSVVLGNHVYCGANVTIIDHDFHSIDPSQRDQKGGGSAESVYIGDNVWLGLNTLILKGVTIGKNTVVGANSVVAKSLPANVIAVGNPARVLRVLDTLS